MCLEYCTMGWKEEHIQMRAITSINQHHVVSSCTIVKGRDITGNEIELKVRSGSVVITSN